MRKKTLLAQDEIKDNASVILEMGDRKITKSEVKAEVQNQLDSTAYLSSMYGQSYDPTDPAAIAQAQNDAIDSLKKDMALTAKAKELGLDELTDEEKAAVQEDAQKAYDEAVDYVKKYMVEGADEMDEEALAKAADEKMAELGVSLDSYVESETKEKIDDKLREYAIKDVAVTDDEIQADYDSKVEADKETYAEKAGSYATAVNNGTTVYYAPAGVRRVKQILTKFKEDDQKVIDDANTALRRRQRDPGSRRRGRGGQSPGDQGPGRSPKGARRSQHPAGGSREGR